MELLTAAQMRAIEQAAIDSGEVTGLELMERAGRGVVEAIFEWRPELAEGKRSAVVLCGPGNNGGDGFVVARLLKERRWTVEVFLYGDEAKLPTDAAENARRWREMVGEVEHLTFPSLSENDYDRFMDAAYRISENDLIVDALFGTGLKRPLEGLKNIIAANDLYEPDDTLMPAKTVAVDVPSGLCADSGRSLGLSDDWLNAMLASLTVTFHRAKVGHYVCGGPDHCGQLIVKDIGL